MSDIPGAVFKFVEYELYHLQDTKKELEQLKKELSEEQLGNMTYDSFSTNKSNSPGSGVENSAINILQNKVAIRASKTINSIEKAVHKLDEDKLILFRKKYKQDKPWQTIVTEMSISQATFFRWRKEIVIRVAQEMGLI